MGMGVVSGMLSPGSDTLYTLCTIESPQWPQWAANDHGVAGAGHYMVTPSLPVMIQGVERYADNITGDSEAGAGLRFCWLSTALHSLYPN